MGIRSGRWSRSRRSLRLLLVCLGLVCFLRRTGFCCLPGGLRLLCFLRAFRFVHFALLNHGRVFDDRMVWTPATR